MGNIAINKASDASNYVYPFRPEKGVDGKNTSISRWMGSVKPPIKGKIEPMWYRVDLGDVHWINRWVVRQMGGVGWSSDYNLSDYKLQGSLDNSNWYDIDGVSGNKDNVTDRSVKLSKTRWVRIYITKGFRNNVNFASIVELEVYDISATDSTLSSLGIYNGSAAIEIQPAFEKETSTYSASVSYDVDAITVKPTSADSKAVITVNGVRVYSGGASSPISLQEGSTTSIQVTVTPVVGDARTYSVNVTKARSPYLKDLVLWQGMSPLTLVPDFSRKTLEYTAQASKRIITVAVRATVESDSAALEINGNSATSGENFNIMLMDLENYLMIEVTTPQNGDRKIYNIKITGV